MPKAGDGEHLLQPFARRRRRTGVSLIQLCGRGCGVSRPGVGVDGRTPRPAWHPPRPLSLSGKCSARFFACATCIFRYGEPWRRTPRVYRRREGLGAVADFLRRSDAGRGRLHRGGASTDMNRLVRISPVAHHCRRPRRRSTHYRNALVALRICRSPSATGSFVTALTRQRPRRSLIQARTLHRVTVHCGVAAFGALQHRN